MALSSELQRLQPYIDRAKTFSGWDLGFIRSRSLDGPVPWDYEREAREMAASATTALDVGTGGGEVYSRIAAGLRGQFVACEQWGVNARVAHARLHAMGIPVVRSETGERRLPFRAGSFDLVLARHEAIHPREVARLLAPGGTFLTQQVIPDTWPELRDYFPRATVFPDHYHEYPQSFREMGFEVSVERFDYRVAFETLGDLVAMLLVAPWTIPDFDPEADLEALLALEAGCGGNEGIVLRDGRYLLRAAAP